MDVNEQGAYGVYVQDFVFNQVTAPANRSQGSIRIHPSNRLDSHRMARASPFLNVKDPPVSFWLKTHRSIKPPRREEETAKAPRKEKTAAHQSRDLTDTF
jgi:hypothetical protein